MINAVSQFLQMCRNIRIREREGGGGREGERQTDRQTDREKWRKTDRQTDRQTETEREREREGWRERERQTDRQTETETERERQREWQLTHSHILDVFETRLERGEHLCMPWLSEVSNGIKTLLQYLQVLQWTYEPQSGQTSWHDYVIHCASA